MIKRLIAALCTASIFTMMIQTVSAVDVSIAEKEKALNALGIYVEEIVYRDNYVKALAGLLYDNPEDFDAEDVAYRMGLVDPGETFEGKKAVTINEALKDAVIVLGYKPVLEEMGGYDNIVGQNKLMDGITSAKDSRISHDNTVRLLYNLLDASPIRIMYDSQEIKYETDSTTTILEQNRKIYKIQGVVTANEYTSLYSANENDSVGYVTINEETYLAGDSGAKDFIGMNVSAYVRDNKRDDDEIIYIIEKSGKNKIIEIDSEDIEAVENDFSSIEYNDGDRSRSAKLETVFSVIYNGVSYADYTTDDLMPEDGKLILIDNDSNGRYDVAIVKEYKTLVVSGINQDDKIIRNKYTFEGSLASLDLGDDEEMDCRIYDSEGNEINFSNIKINDILTVQKSKNGKIIPINVYVTSEKVTTGKVQFFNYDKSELTVNNSTYKMTDDYLNYLESENQTIKAGDGYTFYIDYFGKIAFSKRILSNDYCMFYKILGMEDEVETNYVVKFMDLEGEWNIVSLADKVKIDDRNLKPEEVFTELEGTQPQVVKIRTNAAGKVNAIDFAEASDKYDENKFTKLGEMNLHYRVQDDMRSFDCTYYFENDAKVFIIPKDIRDCEGYGVRNLQSFCRMDTQYPVTIYDRTKFNTAAIFSIKEGTWSASSSGDETRFVVTDITRQCTEDDEVLPVISGATGDYTDISFVGAKSDVFAGIKPGDVISLGLNVKNKVETVDKICSLDSLVNKDMTNYYSIGEIAGTIKDYDATKGIIIIDCGKNVYFQLKGNRSVLRYSISSNKCDMISASEIEPGNKITFQNRYGTFRGLVYVTE